MTEEEFEQILALGETAGAEFKGSGVLSNGSLAAQVVKAVMGMTNHRDGGRVIVGVKESAGTLIPIGLSEDEVKSWNRDDLADKVAAHSEPTPSFRVEDLNYRGKRFVIIEVDEFTDIPVICKRSYGDILHDGAIYSRSRRKPETARIRAQEDMRDLLYLATDKKLRQFLAQAQRAGIPITSANADEDSFGEQMAIFEGNQEVRYLLSNAYWKASVRPLVFSPTRLPEIALTEQILRNAAVDLHGWKLPKSLRYQQLLRGSDYVSNNPSSSYEQQERWRLYQSGQFTYLHVVRNELRPNQTGLRFLDADAVFWPTMIYEFAARLALSQAGDDTMRIEVGVFNIENWHLNQSGFFQFDEYRSSANQVMHVRDVSKAELAANARELALKPAREILARFGWDAPVSWMRDIQTKYM